MTHAAPSKRRWKPFPTTDRRLHSSTASMSSWPLRRMTAGMAHGILSGSRPGTLRQLNWSGTMAASDKLFAGSIPEIYDRFLVPLIFEPYAADLAGRGAMAQPRDVLETAVGTGVLTRALALRLAPSTRIVATDLNPPMLDHASRRQPC